MTAPAIPGLRPYQAAALVHIVTAKEQGLNRLLVKKPTGTGKTVMFADLLKFEPIRAWIDSLPARPGCKMLVIAHREELLDQACAKLRERNPGLMVSIEQGDRYSNGYSDVVIASIQTLAAQNYRRLDRFLAKHQPAIVVVDEAHHAAAATYRTVLARLGFLPTAVSSDTGNIEAASFDDLVEMKKALAGWDAVAPKDRLLLGVTATPNRTDAIGLGCVFQTIAYDYPLQQAIKDGWLVPITPWAIETAEDLDAVKTTAGDFNQKQLAEAVNKARRNRAAVDAWKLYASDRSTIAFCVDVQHAVDLAAIFRADGINAVPLSGETGKDDRRAILKDFAAGRIPVITNCMVLTEGTDLPIASCILHAKPTKSATLYEQMTGRGLRLYPGKTDCCVIDVVDISRKHSLQTAAVLYGLPPGLKTAGETLDDLREQLERIRERVPSFDVDAALAQRRMTVRELLDRASTFNVWDVQPLGDAGAGTHFEWVRTGEVFRLQYPWQDGTETLLVSPDVLGHWDLAATFRPREGNVRQKTLGAQIPTANAALLIGEAFILEHRRTAKRIVDAAADWRSRPASDKQIRLLRRFYQPSQIPDNLTMGRAGRMIDIAKARRGR